MENAELLPSPSLGKEAVAQIVLLSKHAAVVEKAREMKAAYEIHIETAKMLQEKVDNISTESDYQPISIVENATSAEYRSQMATGQNRINRIVNSQSYLLKPLVIQKLSCY